MEEIFFVQVDMSRPMVSLEVSSEIILCVIAGIDKSE